MARRRSTSRVPSSGASDEGPGWTRALAQGLPARHERAGRGGADRFGAAGRRPHPRREPGRTPRCRPTTRRCRRSPTRSSPAARRTRTDLGDEIHPQAIAGVDHEPGAVEADALRLFHHPLIGFDALEPAFLADLQRALAAARRPVPRPRLRQARRGRASTALVASTTPTASCGRRRPRSRSRRSAPRRPSQNAHDRQRLRLPGDGPSGRGAERLPAATPTGASSRASARRRATCASMAERVDVCIVGLGLRRLDLRLPAGRALPGGGRGPEHPRARARPPPQAHRLPPVDGHRAPVERLRPDPVDAGAAARRSWSATASAAARTSTWPRRCARRARRSSAATAIPTTAPSGACGRAQISRATLDPYYARAERALRVQRRAGSRWRSRAGCGRRRSTPPATRCDRVPLRDRPRAAASDAKWCHTGCIYGAKNSVITNYLARGRARSACRCGRTRRSS